VTIPVGMIVVAIEYNVVVVATAAAGGNKKVSKVSKDMGKLKPTEN
jgi:hypothetical protein